MLPAQTLGPIVADGLAKSARLPDPVTTGQPPATLLTGWKYPPGRLWYHGLTAHALDEFAWRDLITPIYAASTPSQAFGPTDSVRSSCAGTPHRRPSTANIDFVFHRFGWWREHLQIRHGSHTGSPDEQFMGLVQALRRSKAGDFVARRRLLLQFCT